MTTYTTPAENAQTIRATLKSRHGWTARQISVRSESYSLGSSIHVTIKDPGIPLATVKAIAEGAEHIRRCSITGEILGGGNRFVSVCYSDTVQLVHGRRYADAVQRAVDKVQPGSSTLEPVEGTNFLVGRRDHLLTLWDADFAGCLYQGHTVDYIAQCIGRMEVAREANAVAVVKETEEQLP